MWRFKLLWNTRRFQLLHLWNTRRFQLLHLWTRDDSNSHIANLSFLCTNVPSSPAYCCFYSLNGVSGPIGDAYFPGHSVLSRLGLAYVLLLETNYTLHGSDIVWTTTRNHITVLNYPLATELGGFILDKKKKRYPTITCNYLWKINLSKKNVA